MPDARGDLLLYPDVTDAARATGCADHEVVRRVVLECPGVSFCRRRQFGHPREGERQSHRRLAHSGHGRDQMQEDLLKMKGFIESHQ